MHIPITVANKKIPKGTRIIKQKLTKKINTKEGKKKPLHFWGRRRVAGWVEGEGSPEVSQTERRWRVEASPTIGSVTIGEL